MEKTCKHKKTESAPRLFFILPHVEICGGNKVIFEAADGLLARGHETFILTGKGEKPLWLSVKTPVHKHEDWARRIKPQDVVIFTWDYDADFAMSVPGRKCYYIQHFVHPREDVFKLPIEIFISVSTYVQKHTKEHYGIDSHLVLNGIDSGVFNENTQIKRRKNRIMTLAWKAWKGFDTVAKAVEIVKAQRPSLDFLAVDNLTPAQMAEAYSSSYIYVSGSWHEGFGLPVLEAMACGCAVVATDSKGIDDFAIDGNTCLKIPVKDPVAMASAITKILDKDALFLELSENGKKTAQRFSWDKSLDKLERIFGLAPVFPDYAVEYAQMSGQKLSEVILKSNAGTELAASEFTAKYKSFEDGAKEYYEMSCDYVYELIGAKADHDLYRRFYFDHVYPALLLSGKDVLDFGSGVGDFSYQASLWGKQVTFCDVPSESMRFAAWHLRKYGLKAKPLAAHDLTGDRAFDLIWCNAVLEHLPNPLDILQKLIHVLNEGGVMYLLVDYNIDQDKYPMHCNIPDFKKKVDALFMESKNLKRIESRWDNVYAMYKTDNSCKQGETIKRTMLKKWREAQEVHGLDFNGKALTILRNIAQSAKMQVKKCLAEV